MKKKKICFFNKDMKAGGVERQLYCLVNGLNSRKYDIMLLLCRKEGEFSGRISDGIGVYGLGVSYSRCNKIFIMIKLFLFLVKNRPDIFISFHSHLNTVSVIVCRLLAMKVFICFPGHFPASRLARLRRFFYTKADMLISVSGGVRDSLVKNLHIPESGKNIIIENCVDMEDVGKKAREETGGGFPDTNRFTIVSAGRLSAEKNFGLLIRAAALLPADCRVLIIGDGEQREYLENLAAEYGLRDMVSFTGFQPNPYRFIKRASVYVLPSDSEGLPTVLLEAMSLGVPCISADYHGRTDDVIEHDVTGYVFRRGNHYELAKAVDFFRDGKNHEKIKRMIENAGARVREFSVEKYVRKYERLFDEYLK